jgi:hypothetical protein
VKKKLSVLLLSSLSSWYVYAADIVIQTNAIDVDIGDSYRYSPDQNPITGCRAFEYQASGMKLMFPYKNIRTFNMGRSGLNMDIARTSSVPVSMALWAYQSNSFQHLGAQLATDNGSQSSNQMYLANSNIFLAPALISDGGLTMTNNGGQYAKPINWIAMGYPGNYAAASGYPGEWNRNYASVNAGRDFGYFSVNSFDGCSNMIATDFVTGGHNWDWVFTPVAHFIAGGAKAWSDNTLMQMFPSKSNLTTCEITWSGTVMTKDNCDVSNVIAGSTLSFDCIEYSMGPAWDNPGDVVRDGTITNNANYAFNLNGNNCEYFKQILKITGLPIGTYRVIEDGVITATLSSTVLAAGWNRGTNTVGPSWDQRVLVLADIRDVQGENQVTLTHTSSGVFGLASASTAVWPTTQGDALIAALNAPAKVCFDLDDIANADSKPRVRHMSIQLVAAYQPAPFR